MLYALHRGDRRSMRCAPKNLSLAPAGIPPVSGSRAFERIVRRWRRRRGASAPCLGSYGNHFNWGARRPARFLAAPPPPLRRPAFPATPGVLIGRSMPWSCSCIGSGERFCHGKRRLGPAPGAGPSYMHRLLQLDGPTGECRVGLRLRLPGGHRNRWSRPPPRPLSFELFRSQGRARAFVAGPVLGGRTRRAARPVTPNPQASNLEAKRLSDRLQLGLNLLLENAVIFVRCGDAPQDRADRCHMSRAEENLRA